MPSSIYNNYEHLQNRPSGPRRLADYVERAYLDCFAQINPSYRPFNNGKAKDPPLVKPRWCSRVLVFPGCFNPPHQGHLHTLKFIMQRAAKELQIIAAVIIPSDESVLTSKPGIEGKCLLLPRDERVRLWRSPGILSDRVWVFDRPEAEWRYGFQANLASLLEVDEIHLKFTLLAGPDWVTTTKTASPRYWGCQDVITSDVSRSIEFRTERGLKQLDICAPWKRIASDVNRIRKRIFETFPEKFGEEREVMVQEEASRLTSVWFCNCIPRKGEKIFFIPTDTARQPNVAPSSTSIRKIIVTTPRENLEHAIMGSCAINGKLLAQIAPRFIYDEIVPEKEEKEDLPWDYGIVW